MERIYFSKQNFNIIYNILRKKTMAALNYDISNDETFNNELIKVMKSLYGKRNTFNIPSNLSEIDNSRYLSQKVINVAAPYFIDTIKKSKTSTEQVNLTRDLSVNNNRINQLSIRPESNTRDNNVQSNYDKLLKERDMKPNNPPAPINFSNTNNANPSSDEINNRYNQIASQRDYEVNNNRSFEHPSRVNNQQLANTNRSNVINQQIRNSNNPMSKSINRFNAFPQSNPNTFNNSQNIQSNNNLSVNPYSQNNSINSFNNVTNTEQLISSNPNPVQNKDVQNTLIDMNGDNINYEELLKHMDQSAPIENSITPDTNVNSQFMNNFTTENIKPVDKENNIESIFPKQLVENSSEKSMPENIIHKNQNIELEIIKKSIESQQNNLDLTNTKIDKLIEVMQSQDLSKFYETVINIPKLMKKQMNEKYRFRTHSLVISSRDRDLLNKEFSKYDFRVVFGDTGSSIQRQRLVNSSANSLGFKPQDEAANMLILDTSTKNTLPSGIIRYYNPTYSSRDINLYENSSLVGSLVVTGEDKGCISTIELVLNTSSNPKRGHGWAVGDIVTINNPTLGGRDAKIKITEVQTTASATIPNGAVLNYRVVDCGKDFVISRDTFINTDNFPKTVGGTTLNLQFRYKVSDKVVNPTKFRDYTANKVFNTSNLIVRVNTKETYTINSINTTSNQIIFSTTAKVSVGDKIKYNNGGHSNISGLTNNSEYYVAQAFAATVNANDTFTLEDINGTSIIFSNSTIPNDTGSESHTFAVDNLIFDNSSQEKPFQIQNLSTSNESTKLSLQNVTYTSSASKNPIVSTKLRNIVSIKLNRVIIPKPRDEVFKPDPYYFVCIDEFGSNIITTKNFNEKIFAKVHFDKELVFGGVANSSIMQESENSATGTTNTIQDHSYDNGRKYMYYKNDDGDETKFYSSPLASLENLTIKILDSRGRLLSLNFNDSDRGTYNSGNTPKISGKFLNNTFIKDNIVNLTENKEGYVSDVRNVTYISGAVSNNNSPNNGEIRVNYENETATNAEPVNDNEFINLTNQIEYIFEVVTKEPDVEKDYMSELI